MITVFLPECLIEWRQQGSLAGVCVSSDDKHSDQKFALIVTAIERRLPQQRLCHIGYVVNSSDDAGLSKAAFSHLENCVLLTNDHVPRLISCSVHGRHVSLDKVTIVLYSRDDICQAPLLCDTMIGDHLHNSNSPAATWDPLRVLVRHVVDECGDTVKCSTPTSCSDNTRPHHLPVSSTVHVGWFRWFVLELCALLLAAGSSQTPGHLDKTSSLRHLSPPPPPAPVSWSCWLLMEAVAALRARAPLLVRPGVVAAVQRWLHALAAQSALLRQVKCRVAMVNYLISDEYGDSSRPRRAGRQFDSMRWLNCAYIAVCDSLLGVCATVVLLLVPDLLQLTLPLDQLALTSLDRVTGHVTDHIEWLINGEPAGVKLNIPLTSSLGDICLWLVRAVALLLSFLVPALTVVLVRAAVPLGCVGFSLLVCLLSDLSCLLTSGVLAVHIVIAALCRLHVRWLVRLWRLFGGRRWNEEKQRVEPWPYSLEQLFLGTLCFTILLFLLPTVLTYHALFVWCRLLVSLWSLALELTVRALNTNPALVSVAWLNQWPRVAGTFRASVLDAGGEIDRYLVVRLNVVNTNLVDTIRFFNPPVSIVRGFSTFSISHFAKTISCAQTIFSYDNRHLNIRSSFAESTR